MKIKDYKEKYYKKIKRKPKVKKKSDYSWILAVTILAFWISIGFSFLSEIIVPNVSLIVAIFVTLLFIGLGIIFDMIGISITVADIKTFNSMASKRVKGAKLASRFIRNSDKASSFCNDVIGDICGIISGGTGIAIANLISSSLDLNNLITTLIITAIIASLTIGGKALGKSIAINNSTKILYVFTRFLAVFTRC